MKEVCYDFVELESDESFERLGKSFGGIVRGNTILFDNMYAKGELIKTSPEQGLWIRKWKLTVLQKVTLNRLSAPKEHPKKLCLIYFLNPSIFDLKDQKKKFRLNKLRNNVFVSNEVTMDFTVVPKQPFYAVDITFTKDWLLAQFEDADPCFKMILDLYLNKDPNVILAEPCNTEEYKILNELDEKIMTEDSDVLFIRPRIYRLVCSFFSKVYNKNRTEVKQKIVHYDQIVKAEAIMMENLQRAPKIEDVARQVNMSVSSLLRQFKLMYGHSIHEYYVKKKMEVAKKMIIENKITIKDLSHFLGYKQASPFIEKFTKQYGYSPGSLMVH